MSTRSESPVTSPPAPAALDPQLRRLAAAVVLGVIMTILDSTIVNVAVTTLGRDFGTSLATIQWVLTGYLLALSMTIPLSGWAVERFGGRTTWLFALAAFIGGSVLCGLAWNVGSLIAFRVMQGVGGGLLMPVGQTMLVRAAGPDRMGRVMSLIGLPAMVAPVLGPVLGGLIVDHLAWQWMFFVNIPVCALALVLALRWLPADTGPRTKGTLDLLGLALLSPGLAALVYGLAEAGNGAGLGSAKVLIGVVGGAALLAGFAVHALRKPDGPLLDLRTFRLRGFTTGVAALFVYAGAMFGLLVLLPLYYQIARGDSPLETGLMVAPFGLGAMITMVVGGRVVDRRGSRGLALTGLVIVAATSLVFTQLQVGTDARVLLAATFVTGLGHGLVAAPLMAAIYQSVPKTSIATATTTANILLRVGSSFGTALLAIILQIYIRAELPGTSGRLDEVAAHPSPDLPGHLVTAFGHSFWWTAALALFALIPALLLPRRHRLPG